MNALPPIEPVVPPRLLDHLIARREIEPIVAVFLESRRSGDSRDYPADAMRRFLASEVPVWAASLFGAGRRGEKRAILGRSYSARETLEAAVAPSGAYGKVGLLIPGRRVGREPEILEMVAQARLRMRVVILAGLYDHANLPTAHALRRTLGDSGHVVEYIEVPEGHTATTWRDHLREVFVALFKPRAAGSGL
jgi:enterochelin esterase-like enzyme